MHHIDDIAVSQSVAGQTTEEEDLSINSHISECPACLERVRTAAVLHHSFERLFDSWSARSHGRIVERRSLLEGLQSAGSSGSGLAEAALRSLYYLKASSTVAFSILLDRTRMLASQAAYMLPRGSSFALSPAFSGVGASQAGAVEEHRKASSQLLAEGRKDEAMAELEQVSIIDKRASQAAVATINISQEESIRAYSDARQGRVWIKVLSTKPTGERRFVFLAPVEPSGPSRIAELTPVAGETYLLAAFDDVASGGFRLFVSTHR